MDQLIARASSVKSKDDLAAWQREKEEVEKFLAKTELGLEWVMEREKEIQAAKELQAARLRADPLVQKLELEARARDAIFSRFPQEAREQYERDRAKRQKGGPSDRL